jgi:hypothetical protein
MTKIWVAYLLPNPTDVFNLLEDGIQWIAKGESKVQAELALRTKFHEQMAEESYSEEEIEKVWNDHHSYCVEI